MGTSQKYWVNGEPFPGGISNVTGDQKNWLNGLPVAPYNITTVTISISIFDTITVSDTFPRSPITEVNKTISETITVGEGFSSRYASVLRKLLEEVISVTESATAQLALQIFVNDSITITEFFNSLVPRLSAHLFESVTVSESTARALATRFIHINASETITVAELIQNRLPIIAAHPYDNTLVAEFVRTSLSLYVKLSENISVAEEILPVLPQIYIKILTDHQISVSDAVTAQLVTFQSKLQMLSYIRRYLNDVVNAPPQSYVAIDPVAPEFIDNSGGFDWEVQKTDLTDYLRRYLNDVVQ